MLREGPTLKYARLRRQFVFFLWRRRLAGGFLTEVAESKTAGGTPAPRNATANSKSRFLFREKDPQVSQIVSRGAGFDGVA